MAWLIVQVETESFGEVPTHQHCEALQATQKSRVLIDTDHLLRDILGLKLNRGVGLLDERGHWVIPHADDGHEKAAAELRRLLGTP